MGITPVFYTVLVLFSTMFVSHVCGFILEAQHNGSKTLKVNYLTTLSLAGPPSYTGKLRQDPFREDDVVSQHRRFGTSKGYVSELDQDKNSVLFRGFYKGLHDRKRTGLIRNRVCRFKRIACFCNGVQPVEKLLMECIVPRLVCVRSKCFVTRRRIQQSYNLKRGMCECPLERNPESPSLQVEKGLIQLKRQRRTTNLNVKTVSCSDQLPTDAPALFIGPTSQIRPLLDNYRAVSPINCSVRHKNTSISLFFNGMPAPHWLQITRSACSLSVSFPKPKLCYVGVYTCLASNVHGNVNKTSKLVYLVSRRTVPSDATVKFAVGHSSEVEGQTVLVIGTKGVITCSSPTLGSTVIQFKLEDKISRKLVIASESKYRNIVWGNPWSINGRTYRNFTIANVSSVDARKYACEVVTDYTNECPFMKTIKVSTATCRSGYYCTHQSWKEFPCPPGTFSNLPNVFGKENCKQCPLGFYCPLNSTFPTPCGKDTHFGPFYPRQGHALRPAGKFGDCQRCPLNATCSTDMSCSFICAAKAFITASSDSLVRLSCNLAENISIHQLLWRKDGAIILPQRDKFKIYAKEGEFLLEVSSLDEEDAGRYTCEGILTAFGKKDIQTILLTVSGTGYSHFYLTLLLIPVLIGGFLSYKERRKILSLARHYLFKSKSTTYTGTSSSSVDSDQPLDKVVRCTPLTAVDYGDHTKSYNQEDGLGTPTIFDAFICYSNRDKEWVLGHLVPELEKRGIKLCLHFKHFAVGESIIENILDAIYKSRKTIAVLSPDFVSSDWCNHELENALARIHKHQVIPIFYKHCEVPRILRQKTYLDWTDEDGKLLFWDRLVDGIHRES